MSDKKAEWANFFNEFFKEVRKMILEQYRVEEDESGPPEIMAIRKVADNFPCPVRIAEIKIDIEKHKHIKDEICQIIRYDFSELGVQGEFVEYCGFADAKDSEKLKKLLVEKFDLTFSFEDFHKDFRMTGWSDDETTFFTQFPCYDIRKDLRRYVWDFYILGFDTFLGGKIRQEYGKGINWKSKFNLNADQILPMSEIIKMDKTLSAFFPFSEGQNIEELQKEICNIQLIQTVPEGIQKIFRNAKDLFIYGYFRYNFFTTAQHYAYLALESAIKNKYYQSFSKENILENNKGETVKIGNVDHKTVMDICRLKGWKRRQLKINGEKFLFSIDNLLDWLVDKKIITKWERKQCKKGMDMRNIMSHLTHVIILPHGYSIRAFEFVADIINKLYLPKE
jgi:hypothetical protein